MVKLINPKLLRNLLLATLILAALIVIFILAYMPRVRNQAVTVLMHHKTEQIIGRFHSFIQPIISNLRVLHDWGHGGLFDLENTSLPF